jgi:23S rRNA pseudouridine1911/1915/1917 synthase
VHPGAGTESETTLVEGVLFYLNRSPVKGELRPGIVHRLDKDTTGALVISKNEFAHQKLSIQFAEKSNRREYAALLGGVLQDREVVVENYLLRDANNRLKFIAAASDPGGSSRWSKSTFTEQARFLHRISLASVQLHTGRTHQIRVHAKTLNCPVLGDQLYGKKVDLGGHAPKELQIKLNKIPRQMLHARLLGFVHPITGESMLFDAPLPSDFRDILHLLKDHLN